MSCMDSELEGAAGRQHWDRLQHVCSTGFEVALVLQTGPPMR
jgi:hypothetical protein